MRNIFLKLLALAVARARVCRMARLVCATRPAQTTLWIDQARQRPRGATRQMIESGIGMQASSFNLLDARVQETIIKAGGYQVSTGVTPWQLMKKITQGDFAQSEVVFIEGWTFRQMRAALDVHSAVRHDSADFSDADLMRRLGADTLIPEGLFFPDTYLFGKGESDLAILARAHRPCRSSYNPPGSGVIPEYRSPTRMKP
jgi:UPF0755 protein